MFDFYLFSALLLSLFIVIVFLDLKYSKVKHHLSYKDRKLIIDDFIIIAAFRTGSLNEEIFEYLYNHQNQKVFLSDLERNVFKGRTVIFNKIVDSLGFKSDLKRLLFTTGKDFIIYHPDKINNKKLVKVNR